MKTLALGTVVAAAAFASPHLPVGRGTDTLG